MKRLIPFFYILAVVLGAGRVAAEVREFTTKEGVAVFGEILDYSIKSDVVKIKTDGGKTIQTTASSFRDEDFMYIRDWDAVRLFSKNTDFRVYLSEPISKNKWAKYLWRRPPGKNDPVNILKIYHNRIYYEIKFENQTGYNLENVDIKYCIYYEQERIDPRIEEKVTDLVVRPSIHHYAIVPDKLNKKFESNSIVLRDKDYQAGSRLEYLEGEGRFIKSRIIGMVFRATITTVSGPSAVREVRVPRGLSEKYVWVEPTPENTVWPDDGLDESEDTNKPKTLYEEMGGSGGDEE
jgi:hypothetical protein